MARRPSKLLSDRRWRLIAIRLRLSQREFQIVRHIFDGEKEIVVAAALDISVHTVHTHVKRLYQKLGVGDRCGLLIRVFEAYLAIERE